MRRPKYYTLLCCLTAILSSGPGALAVGTAARAAERTTESTRQPLQVTIRPRAPRQDARSPLLNHDVRRQIQENVLEFDWERILDHRYLSGHQDEDRPRRYGYGGNADIAVRLREKQREAGDPDNMRHSGDYRDRLLYAGAVPEVLDPMTAIKQGCPKDIPGKCGFARYGQYWLKSGMRDIAIAGDRADNALVNLLKSLE